MKRIGVLSDTHGLLRPQVTEALRGCDAILHGGDINRQSVLDALAEIAPVYAVRGNNDREWAEAIPQSIRTELFGLRVFMTHKKKDIPKELDGIDLVVYGHSHRYDDRTENGVRFLNPGSCGPRRFGQEAAMALVDIAEDGTLRVEKIVIPVG